MCIYCGFLADFVLLREMSWGETEWRRLYLIKNNLVAFSTRTTECGNKNVLTEENGLCKYHDLFQGFDPLRIGK